ncbi:MAG TPA: hypothetical protein VMN76_03460 [Acidobacteriota bacterium]|nr:hypothetical protein [Acidobacteriota bacterium]
MGYKFIAEVDELPGSFAERSQVDVLISEETIELDEPEAGGATARKSRSSRIPMRPTETSG